MYCRPSNFCPTVDAILFTVYYATHNVQQTTIDDDDDEGQINFSVALSPKTTRTHNNKPKQWSHVIVVSAMRRC